MALIRILDENLYIKKTRALKKYFTKVYKCLIFEILPKLMLDGKKDGVYEVDLPTEELFEKVYGKIKLKFSVKDDNVIIEDITPNDILIACYCKTLPTYKGIPYDSDKDLKKLKIMERLL